MTFDEVNPLHRSLTVAARDETSRARQQAVHISPGLYNAPMPGHGIAHDREIR
jgi:hypothetical protein